MCCLKPHNRGSCTGLIDDAGSLRIFLGQTGGNVFFVKGRKKIKNGLRISEGYGTSRNSVSLAPFGPGFID